MQLLYAHHGKGETLALPGSICASTVQAYLCASCMVIQKLQQDFC
jgi:hypothetical protein